MYRIYGTEIVFLMAQSANTDTQDMQKIHKKLHRKSECHFTKNNIEKTNIKSKIWWETVRTTVIGWLPGIDEEKLGGLMVKDRHQGQYTCIYDDDDDDD